MSQSLHSAVPTRPLRTPARVVVGVLVAPDAPAVAGAETSARWRRLTPLATWLRIPLDETSRAGILRGVAAAIDRSGVTPPQLILLGEGRVARGMLDLALQGELQCGGIVAIDASCGAPPFRIMPTATAFRLVVRHDGHDEPRGGLIGAMRAGDLDARIINLDFAGGRGAGAAARATETFVLELVATIGRRATDGARDR